jgi:hypothetical protein
MTDAEKEMIIESKKRQFRNMYPQDVADELCRRLDEAKKCADIMEQLYNQQQQSSEQLIKLLKRF